MRIHVLAAVAIALVPASAVAQTATPTGNTGPLVLQRIDNGMLIAPDYKITSFDGQVGQLLGATGGWSQDNTLFLGGAWYWLANGSHNRELSYGGFMVGWTAPSEGHFQVGARSLIGFGTATLGVTYPAPILVPSPRDARIRGSQPVVPSTVTRQYLAWDDFFVFEPQASFRAVINRHTRLNLGAGYRVTGGGDVLEDRLNGATGNISVEFRFF
ncbi:MAG TPA: hypothetical protein VH417_10185 [Vicinamibacterales bacterium]|jgi:hypothetical protein